MEIFISKFNLIILTMIETIKVSSRGQVVIPEAIRKDLSIKEGVRLVLIRKGNKLILEKEEDFLKEHEDTNEQDNKKSEEKDMKYEYFL